MKNTSCSILKIAAILLISFMIFSNTANADTNEEKYMKVHIRDIVDTLDDGFPEFYNDTAIVYQKDDQIVTDNNCDSAVTVCFNLSAGGPVCYDLNPYERTQNPIPANSISYTVKVLGTEIITDSITLIPHTPVPSLSTYGVVLLLLLLMVATVYVIRKRASGAVNL